MQCHKLLSPAFLFHFLSISIPLQVNAYFFQLTFVLIKPEQRLFKKRHLWPFQYFHISALTLHFFLYIYIYNMTSHQATELVPFEKKVLKAHQRSLRPAGKLHLVISVLYKQTQDKETCPCFLGGIKRGWLTDYGQCPSQRELQALSNYFALCFQHQKGCRMLVDSLPSDQVLFGDDIELTL